MNKLFFSVIFVFFIMGCKRANDGERIDSFSGQVKVTEFDSIIVHGEILCSGVSCLRSYKNYLVLQNKNADKALLFVNKENGKIDYAWGTIGRASNEFSDFGVNFSIYNDSLCFMDISQRKMIFSPIDKILSGENNFPIRKEQCPITAEFRPNQFCVVDGKKVLLGCFENERYGVLDGKNNILKTNSNYPFDVGTVKGIYKGTVFQGKIVPNDKRFAIFTLSSDIFELYESTADSIRLLYHSPGRYIPAYTDDAGRYRLVTSRNIKGIIDLATHESGVFLLYSDTPQREYRDEGSKIVLHYSWEGEKIRKYILPHYCKKICADRKMLFCLSEDENTAQYKIYKFPYE